MITHNELGTDQQPLATVVAGGKVFLELRRREYGNDQPTERKQSDNEHQRQRVLVQNFAGQQRRSHQPGIYTVVNNNIVQNTGGNGAVVDQLAFSVLTKNTIITIRARESS